MKIQGKLKFASLQVFSLQPSQHMGPLEFSMALYSHFCGKMHFYMRYVYATLLQCFYYVAIIFSVSHTSGCVCLYWQLRFPLNIFGATLAVATLGVRECLMWGFLWLIGAFMTLLVPLVSEGFLEEGG